MVFILWMKTDEVLFSSDRSVSVVFIFPLKTDEFKNPCSCEYGMFSSHWCTQLIFEYFLGHYLLNTRGRCTPLKFLSTINQFCHGLYARENFFK